MTLPSAPLYREIPLDKGMVARISPHRYEEYISYKWIAKRSNTTGKYYAFRWTKMVHGKRRMIWMHRQVLGLEPGDPRTGDHRNTNETLDNTDENLRIANRREQQGNKEKQRNNTSGYKGVGWDDHAGKWRARIIVNRKYVHLGLFTDPKAAHAAYCVAAKKYFGEFARAA